MTIVKRQVKLYVYRLESEETIVDTMKAEAWEDFLIIKLDFGGTTRDAIDRIEEATRGINKKVIVIPADANIEFYGVTEDQNDPAQV